jgi:hypothetical protein
MDHVAPILSAYVTAAPVYVVMIAGLVVALVKWRAHPRVCALAAGGFGVMLLTSLLGTAVAVTLPISWMESGKTHAEVGLAMGTIGLVRNVFTAIGWGLLVAAVFVDRKPAAQSPD